MSGVDCEWFPTLPSGSWADWATVGVASVALIAAFVAARAAWSQNKSTLELLAVERQREDRAEQAESRRVDAESRAHQADLVAAWTAYHAHVISRDGSRAIRDCHAAEVHNNSLLPIYDLTATFVGPDGRMFGADESETLKVLPPGEETIPGPDALREVTTFNSETNLAAGTYYFLKDFDEGGLRVAIEFRDTAGRRWNRDHNGLLREISNDEP